MRSTGFHASRWLNKHQGCFSTGEELRTRMALPSRIGTWALQFRERREQDVAPLALLHVFRVRVRWMWTEEEGFGG